jgi:peptidoglycan hydrolase-like protein with peptidoglycan-binding domain
VLLQRFLIANAFLVAGKDTGYFGKLTQAAVQAYQRSTGLVSSGTPATTGYGVVGPKTRAALAQCSLSSAPTPPPPTITPVSPISLPSPPPSPTASPPPPTPTPSPVASANYGLKADGVTDDFTALQAAIGECAGGIVRLPAGKIKISGGIALTKGCTIEGVGADGSIESVANPTGTAIVSTNPEQSVFYITTPASVTIRDLGIFMPERSSAVGIFIRYTAQIAAAESSAFACTGAVAASRS